MALMSVPMLLAESLRRYRVDTDRCGLILDRLYSDSLRLYARNSAYKTVRI